MNIKTTVTTLGMAGILFANPIIASAQTVTSIPKANQATRMADLHTRADTAISTRLTSLNTASTRVNGLTKLSSDQKTKFSGEISTDVNGLTTLKAKVDADTDITTLRKDYKTIFTLYRVYAEFLPQLHLLVASDTMGVTTDKLTDLATKLQDRIQKAGNPSNLTTLLSDIQTKVADAEKQYSTVQTQVTSLTPQSYDTDPTGTKSTLQNARSEIRTGAGDLKTAWTDAKQILQALKVNTTNPSPTITQ